jgi:hypothetical protein
MAGAIARLALAQFTAAIRLIGAEHERPASSGTVHERSTFTFVASEHPHTATTPRTRASAGS